jgi:hypothetical protein
MGSVQNLMGMASCLSQLSRRDACPTRLLSSLIKLFVNPYTKFRSVSNEEQSTLYRYGLMYLATAKQYFSAIYIMHRLLCCGLRPVPDWLTWSIIKLRPHPPSPTHLPHPPHPRTYLPPLTPASFAVETNPNPGQT